MKLDVLSKKIFVSRAGSLDVYEYRCPLNQYFANPKMLTCSPVVMLTNCTSYDIFTGKCVQCITNYEYDSVTNLCVQKVILSSINTTNVTITLTANLTNQTSLTSVNGSGSISPTNTNVNTSSNSTNTTNVQNQQN